MERVTQAEIDEMRSCGYDRTVVAKAEALLGVCAVADILAERVSVAFQGVTLGNGIGLRESFGIDSYRERLQELRESDEKLDWRRISVELLNECYSAPFFFDAEGMRFHLPAYLIAELRGELRQDFMNLLIINSFGDTSFIELLTPPQRHTVIACISLCGLIERDRYNSKDMSEAIRRYS